MKKLKILIVLAVVSISLSSCDEKRKKKDGFLGIFGDEIPTAPNTNVSPSWEAVNDNVKLMDDNLKIMLKKAGK